MSDRLISSDSHINEPPDLWTSRAPAALADQVPAVIPVEQGDAWVTSPEARPRPVSTSAVAGTKREDYMKKPVTYKAMRPGSFDPKARLEDMDIDGVEAEVLYPGIARALDTFYNKDVRQFCAAAYNDWIGDFQSLAPERLIGLAILPPIDDGDSAVSELRRAHSLGLRGAWLALPVDGMPLSDPSAEQLWATAEELNIPISLHIGTGRAMLAPTSNPERATLPGMREAFLSTIPMSINEHLAVLIFSGVLERHPGLRIVIAESGVGWIPYFLERMESVYDRHRHYLKSQVSRPPTQVFHEHFFVTFQEDLAGIQLRDMLGVNTMMWASDYPHTDTTWPESRNVVEKYFAGVPENDRERIVFTNCANLYGIGVKV
jgi:predicted TIM-barrel fold metal-dependent hydrolase